MTATFKNKGTDPTLENAELFYKNGNELQFWAKLGQADPDVIVNTYKSHVWVVKAEGKEVKSWEITSPEPTEQEFVV